ncbi:hypothetical protein HZA57_04800 [Candidatus Poribacteria bacterium]|nr:hypothetical protein [Candidatus Poribacteria bacterium]
MLISRVRLFHLLALLAAVCGAAFGAGPAPSRWQLVFAYNADALLLESADPVVPMPKASVTPGIVGAPAVVDCAVAWLDGQNRVLSRTRTGLPLGQRIFMSGEAPCESFIPRDGVIVVRLDGPPAGTSVSAIELTPANTRTRGVAESSVPGVFSRGGTMRLPVPEVRGGPRTPGPKGVTKIRDTGPDGNRLVIVVMGDGYTAANLSAGDFTQHASELADAFDGRSPWDVYFSATNVYRVDVESNQQGSDNEQQGVLKDTYFNSTFWTFGIERLLTIDSVGQERAIAAANTFVGAGVWDSIFILVNSAKYGGAGGSISVSSVHPSGPEIILHEFGHTFAGLADEYSDPYPGFPPGDGEPNVDFDASGPGLKWLVWVGQGTPLPTPDTSQYNNTVGTFEGARYLTSGIYRPWRNCLMKALGQEFCPVCKEAHALEFMEIAALADSQTPPQGGVIDVPAGGADFSVSPLPLPGLTYLWTLDSQVLAGKTGPSIRLMPSDFRGNNQSLQVTVSDPTTLVRLQTIGDSYHWTVKTDAVPQSGNAWILGE